MTLTLFAKYGAFRLLELVNDKIIYLADKVKVPKTLIFILGVVAMLAIGFAGVYLLKAISAAGLGALGALAGASIFTGLQEKFSLFEKLPSWGSIVFAVILAIVLCYLGWKRSTYGFFAAMLLVGYYLTAHYISTGMFISLAGAVGFALVCVLFLKYSLMLMTSFGAGVFTVSFLSVILPKIEAFQLSRANPEGIILVGCVGLLFMIVQFATTRHYKLS